MRNVVALVDLDDESSWRKVLPAAIDNARQTGARLHVLNVVPDGMFKMTIVAQLIPQDYERQVADDAKQQLASVIGEYETDDVQLEPVVRLGSADSREPPLTVRAIRRRFVTQLLPMGEGFASLLDSESLITAFRESPLAISLASPWSCNCPMTCAASSLIGSFR